MRIDSPEVPPDEMSEVDQQAMTYRWGNFMRKTSLDEIPQLFNILKGDMSFIGPRPGAAHNEEHLVELRETYLPSAYLVKPGLSGYAQIKLKRDHDPEKKAKLDSYYVLHMSFWFDVKLFCLSLLIAVGLYKGR